MILGESNFTTHPQWIRGAQGGGYEKTLYNPLRPQTTRDRENVKLTIKKAHPAITIFGILF
jgi:hypothetical protein